DDTADRRAIDDCAAALAEHLVQLVLHAAPDAAQVDGDHAIPFVAADLGGLHASLHDAGVVECSIEPSERGHGSVDHGRHLSVIGDVAANGERLATAAGELLGRAT